MDLPSGREHQQHIATNTLRAADPSVTTLRSATCGDGCSDHHHHHGTPNTPNDGLRINDLSGPASVTNECRRLLRRVGVLALLWWWTVVALLATMTVLTLPIFICDSPLSRSKECLYEGRNAGREELFPHDTFLFSPETILSHFSYYFKRLATAPREVSAHQILSFAEARGRPPLASLQECTYTFPQSTTSGAERTFGFHAQPQLTLSERFITPSIFTNWGNHFSPFLSILPNLPIIAREEDAHLFLASFAPTLFRLLIHQTFSAPTPADFVPLAPDPKEKETSIVGDDGTFASTGSSSSSVSTPSFLSLFPFQLSSRLVTPLHLFSPLTFASAATIPSSCTSLRSVVGLDVFDPTLSEFVATNGCRIVGPNNVTVLVRSTFVRDGHSAAMLFPLERGPGAPAEPPVTPIERVIIRDTVIENCQLIFYGTQDPEVRGVPRAYFSVPLFLEILSTRFYISHTQPWSYGVLFSGVLPFGSNITIGSSTVVTVDAIYASQFSFFQFANCFIVRSSSVVISAKATFLVTGAPELGGGGEGTMAKMATPFSLVGWGDTLYQFDEEKVAHVLNRFDSSHLDAWSTFAVKEARLVVAARRAEDPSSGGGDAYNFFYFASLLYVNTTAVFVSGLMWIGGCHIEASFNETIGIYNWASVSVVHVSSAGTFSLTSAVASSADGTGREYSPASDGSLDGPSARAGWFTNETNRQLLGFDDRDLNEGGWATAAANNGTSSFVSVGGRPLRYSAWPAGTSPALMLIKNCSVVAQNASHFSLVLLDSTHRYSGAAQLWMTVSKGRLVFVGNTVEGTISNTLRLLMVPNHHVAAILAADGLGGLEVSAGGRITMRQNTLRFQADTDPFSPFYVSDPTKGTSRTMVSVLFVHSTPITIGEVRDSSAGPIVGAAIGDVSAWFDIGSNRLFMFPRGGGFEGQRLSLLLMYFATFKVLDYGAFLARRNVVVAARFVSPRDTLNPFATLVFINFKGTDIQLVARSAVMAVEHNSCGDCVFDSLTSGISVYFVEEESAVTLKAGASLVARNNSFVNIVVTGPAMICNATIAGIVTNGARVTIEGVPESGGTPAGEGEGHHTAFIADGNVAGIDFQCSQIASSAIILSDTSVNSIVTANGLSRIVSESNRFVIKSQTLSNIRSGLTGFLLLSATMDMRGASAIIVRRNTLIFAYTGPLPLLPMSLSFIALLGLTTQVSAVVLQDRTSIDLRQNVMGTDAVLPASMMPIAVPVGGGKPPFGATAFDSSVGTWGYIPAPAGDGGVGTRIELYNNYLVSRSASGAMPLMLPILFNATQLPAVSAATSRFFACANVYCPSAADYLSNPRDSAVCTPNFANVPAVWAGYVKASPLRCLSQTRTVSMLITVSGGTPTLVAPPTQTRSRTPSPQMTATYFYQRPPPTASDSVSFSLSGPSATLFSPPLSRSESVHRSLGIGERGRRGGGGGVGTFSLSGGSGTATPSPRLSGATPYSLRATFSGTRSAPSLSFSNPTLTSFLTLTVPPSQTPPASTTITTTATVSVSRPTPSPSGPSPTASRSVPGGCPALCFNLSFFGGYNNGSTASAAVNNQQKSDIPFEMMPLLNGRRPCVASSAAQLPHLNNGLSYAEWSDGARPRRGAASPAGSTNGAAAGSSGSGSNSVGESFSKEASVVLSWGAHSTRLTAARLTYAAEVPGAGTGGGTTSVSPPSPATSPVAAQWPPSQLISASYSRLPNGVSFFRPTSSSQLGASGGGGAGDGGTAWPTLAVNDGNAPAFAYEPLAAGAGGGGGVGTVASLLGHELSPAGSGLTLRFRVTFSNEEAANTAFVVLRLGLRFWCGAPPAIPRPASFLPSQLGSDDDYYEFPVTILLRPPPPVEHILSPDLQAVVTAGAAVGSLLSGGAAAELQTLAILGMISCSKGAARMEGDLAVRSLSPLALDSTCSGALEGSFIAALGFAALHALAAVVAFYNNRRKEKQRRQAKEAASEEEDEGPWAKLGALDEEEAMAAGDSLSAPLLVTDDPARSSNDSAKSRGRGRGGSAPSAAKMAVSALFTSAFSDELGPAAEGDEATNGRRDGGDDSSSGGRDSSDNCGGGSQQHEPSLRRESRRAQQRLLHQQRAEESRRYHFASECLSAMDVVQFPSASLLVFGFLRKGFFVCAVEVLRSANFFSAILSAATGAGGGGGDSDMYAGNGGGGGSGANNNATSSGGNGTVMPTTAAPNGNGGSSDDDGPVFRDAGLIVLGAAGLAFIVLVFALTALIAARLASRAYYPKAYTIADWRIRRLVWVFLASGGDDQTVPGAKAFSGVVGKFRVPHRWAFSLTWLPFVATVPLVLGVGSSCLPLYGLSVAIYAATGAAIVHLRPFRTRFQNAYVPVSMALSAAVVGLHAAILESPFDVPSYAADGVAILAMIQLALSVVRSGLTFVTFLVNFLYAKGVLTPRPAELSCAFEVVAWPFPVERRCTRVFTWSHAASGAAGLGGAGAGSRARSKHSSSLQKTKGTNKGGGALGTRRSAAEIDAAEYAAFVARLQAECEGGKKGGNGEEREGVEGIVVTDEGAWGLPDAFGGEGGGGGGRSLLSSIPLATEEEMAAMPLRKSNSGRRGGGGGVWGGEGFSLGGKQTMSSPQSILPSRGAASASISASAAASLSASIGIPLTADGVDGDGDADSIDLEDGAGSDSPGEADSIDVPIASSSPIIVASHSQSGIGASRSVPVRRTGPLLAEEGDGEVEMEEVIRRSSRVRGSGSAPLPKSRSAAGATSAPVGTSPREDGGAWDSSFVLTQPLMPYSVPSLPPSPPFLPAASASASASVSPRLFASATNPSTASAAAVPGRDWGLISRQPLAAPTNTKANGTRIGGASISRPRAALAASSSSVGGRPLLLLDSDDDADAERENAQHDDAMPRGVHVGGRPSIGALAAREGVLSGSAATVDGSASPKAAASAAGAVGGGINSGRGGFLMSSAAPDPHTQTREGERPLAGTVTTNTRRPQRRVGMRGRGGPRLLSEEDGAD